MMRDKVDWDPYCGPIPDLTALPMDYRTGEEDYLFDDGNVLATIGVRSAGRIGENDGLVAVIHEYYAKAEDLQGARSGIGRSALVGLRSHFAHVMAGGVGDPYMHVDDGDTGPLVRIEDQPAFLFWRAMLREGLIDEIDLMHCGTRIDRANFHEPVRSSVFGLVQPDPRDAKVTAPAPRP